jgi:hypothetical protein
MSQTNQSSQRGGNSLRTASFIGLVLIAIVSFGFAGYTSLSPHVTTVTQREFITNTQNFYRTQTTTSTTTSASTITSTTSVGNMFGYQYNPYYQYDYAYYQNWYYQNCGAYCPPPSSDYLNNYNSCDISNISTGSNMVRCYGYLSQDSNGCVELIVPMNHPYYYAQESPAYEYYSLHNLPSQHPPPGSWVTLTGQAYWGPTTNSGSASCPVNYINVTSISQ